MNNEQKIMNKKLLVFYELGGRQKKEHKGSL